MGQVAWSAGGRRPAREIATRELEGSEWSISRPALALPPPTGTATRPRHRPWVSQPVPSGPSGALHTGGAGSLMCALRVDSLSGQAPPLPINFARNSPAACSNIECTSLELQRFWGVSKNDHYKLRASFLGSVPVAARGCRRIFA